MSDTGKLFLFYLAPEFTLLAFTSAIEALRLANQVIGQKRYTWRVISSDGRAVQASCGLTIGPDLSLSEARELVGGGAKVEMSIVCSGRNVQDYLQKSLDKFLRECRRKRISLGAVCTGPYLLANAGLLKGKRCTNHWENYPSFLEVFTDVEASSQLFEVDDGIYTCAGGTSSLDMMLHIVAQDQGADVAREICQQAIVGVIRHKSERQRLPFSLPQDVKNETLKAIIALMEENLADAFSPEVMARKVGYSRRQLERLFQKELACSPSRYYTRLKLQRAKSLLEQTGMPVVEVAVACGFVSASHFSKVYRDREGEAPQEFRKSRRPDCIPSNIALLA